MLKISENTIYDPTTGICYTLSEGWNYAQTYEEAKEEGETWPRVSATSAPSSVETYGLTFQKEEAVNLWKFLNLLISR